MVLLTRKPHLGRANARIRQVRDGKALCIHRSVENTAKAIARFSQADAKRYRELCQRFVTEMGPLMTDFGRH